MGFVCDIFLQLVQDISSAKLLSLFKAISQCRLYGLDLNGRYLAEIEVDGLASMIKSNSHLTSLRLQNFGFNHHERLAAAFESNYHLLDVSLPYTGGVICQTLKLTSKRNDAIKVSETNPIRLWCASTLTLCFSGRRLAR